jgi:hypothetical protein
MRRRTTIPHNSSANSIAAIHGNKSQGARTRALAEFKSLKLHVLAATDIAARGMTSIYYRMCSTTEGTKGKQASNIKPI